MAGPDPLLSCRQKIPWSFAHGAHCLSLMVTALPRNDCGTAESRRRGICYRAFWPSDTVYSLGPGQAGNMAVPVHGLLPARPLHDTSRSRVKRPHAGREIGAYSAISNAKTEQNDRRVREACDLEAKSYGRIVLQQSPLLPIHSTVTLRSLIVLRGSVQGRLQGAASVG
eukprot:2966503-Rhodomonas_salina.3